MPLALFNTENSIVRLMLWPDFSFDPGLDIAMLFFGLATVLCEYSGDPL